MNLERKKILDSCRRRLNGHYPRSIQKSLLELVDYIDPHQMPDAYGQGEVVQSLERRVAGLLGKEAALFFPSGTMAQQIALRCWAERSGNKNVALHFTSHLEQHEEDGYRILHDFRGLLTGDLFSPLSLQNLTSIKESFGAAVLELPQRHSGGVLPDWEGLTSMSNWCREHGVVLHMDGARLWESTGFYQKSLAEISNPFDSVYVSFYKGLGANGGAMLAGPAEFIKKAAVWQRRHGGNLFNLYPIAVSAAHGLETKLAKFPLYMDKARSIAEIVSPLTHITAVPGVPHTNMMHLSFTGSVEKVEAALLQIAVDNDVFIGNRLWQRTFAKEPVLELYVGDGAMDLNTGEITKILTSLNDHLQS